jgi:hypothetical protein
MDYRNILYGALFFILGQMAVWIQINGPIIWQWAKDWRWALMLVGIPITWFFMEGTQLLVNGFDGAFWPSRFISFAMGILVFTLFTYLFRGEGITIKTALSLLLAVGIISIQLFWK